MAGWNFGGCAGMNIGNTEMPEPIPPAIICPFLSHRIRTLCFHNHSITSSSICLSLGWQAFCFVITQNHYYCSSCFGFMVVVQFAVHWYLLPYYEYAIEPPTSFRSSLFCAEMFMMCYHLLTETSVTLFGITLHDTFAITDHVLCSVNSHWRCRDVEAFFP